MITAIIKEINDFFNTHRSAALLCVALTFYLTFLAAYRLWSDTPDFYYLKYCTENGIYNVDSVIKIRNEMEFRKYMEKEIIHNSHQLK